MVFKQRRRVGVGLSKCHQLFYPIIVFLYIANLHKHPLHVFKPHYKSMEVSKPQPADNLERERGWLACRGFTLVVSCFGFFSLFFFLLLLIFYLFPFCPFPELLSLSIIKPGKTTLTPVAHGFPAPLYCGCHTLLLAKLIGYL